MLDIKVEKKKTKANTISSFKNTLNSDQIINEVIFTSLKNKTIKNNIDWKRIISNIVREKPNIFQIINSYLFIGLLSIKKIVFHSTSLNKSWLQTKSTHTSQKISIIANQKSTITLESSQIVNFHKTTEKSIKIKAKNKIIYKNLFLTISLKVLIAIFNIFIKLLINKILETRIFPI